MLHFCSNKSLFIQHYSRDRLVYEYHIHAAYLVPGYETANYTSYQSVHLIITLIAGANKNNIDAEHQWCGRVFFSLRVHAHITGWVDTFAASFGRVCSLSTAILVRL